MRSFLSGLSVVLLGSVLIPGLAQAAGNVLLPPASGTGTTSSLPSLGLSAPALSPAANDQSQTPATAAQPTPPPAPTPTPVAQIPTPAIATAPATLAQTPAPTSTGAQSFIQSVDDPQTAASLPPGKMPTHIVHLPNTSLSSADKNLPYTLTIAFSPQSIFSAADVETIGNQLGLSRDQISASCYLSARGFVRTSSNSYIVNGGSAPQVAVRYDGAIQGYMLGAIALCAADRLPHGAGFITETGGRYIVSLSPINCDAPTRQVSQLTITYNGGDRSQCAYQ